MKSKPAMRRERERENMRQTILSAARDVLVQQGHEAISIRVIADAIEYSPAAIYLHFKDKDALLLELIDEGFRMLSSAIRGAEDVDVFEGLVKKGLAYLGFAVRHPRHYELMFLARSPAHQEFMRSHSGGAPDCFLALVEAVVAAQTQGVLRRDLPVPVLAYTIWGQVHGIASIAIAKQFLWIPEDQVPTLLEESVRAVLTGLGQ